MSQEDVLNLIKELKGEATTKEIRDLARKKYPQRTLYLYVGNRLRNLEKNNEIEQIGDKWRIKKHGK